jgi:peroxiredoxin
MSHHAGTTAILSIWTLILCSTICFSSVASSDADIDQPSVETPHETSSVRRIVGEVAPELDVVRSARGDARESSTAVTLKGKVVGPDGKGVAGADDLLQYILAEIESSAHRIKTYEIGVEGSFDCKIPGRIPHVEASYNQIGSGDKWFATYKKSVPGRPDLRGHNYEARMLVGEDYSAFWPDTENIYGYIYDHHSIERMTDEARELVFGANMSEERFTHFSFIYPGSALKRGYEKTLDKKGGWRVSEVLSAEAQTVYDVRRYVPGKDGRIQEIPSIECIIDPAKGFHMTHFVFRNTRNGSIRIFFHANVEDVAPGYWFPKSVIMTAFGREAGPVKESLTILSPELLEFAKQTDSFELRDIYSMEVRKLNEPVDEDLFKWTALGLVEGTKVKRTDTSGRVETYKVMGEGLLLPRRLSSEMLEWLLLVGKQAPELGASGWMSGESITLESQRGNAIVVAFWDHTDKACAELVPLLNGLVSEYPEKGLEIISMHIADADLDDLSKFISDRSIKFRVAVDKPAENYKGGTFEKYNVWKVPAVFIIGPEGKVRYQDIPLEAVEEALEQLLDEQ